MKRWIAVCICLLLFTAACTGEAATAETEAAVDTADAETEMETEEETEAQTEEADIAEANYENAYWKAVIPDEWEVNAEDSSEDESSMVFNGTDGETAARVHISESADPSPIRSAVEEAGFSQEDLQNQTLEDGVFVGDHYGFSYTVFGGQQIEFRSQEHQINGSIMLRGDDITEEEQKFLDTFVLLTETYTETDPPFAHEGESYQAQTGSVSVGDYTLDAEFLQLEPVLPTYKTFYCNGRQSGDHFYIVKLGELFTYDLADQMKLIHTEKLDHSITEMSVMADGSVLLSEPYEQNYLLIEEGTTPFAIDTDLLLTLHSSGTWGISHFFDMDDIEKITFNEDGSVTQEPIHFADKNGEAVQNMAAGLFVLSNRIAIAGNSDQADAYVIGIYHTDGSLDRMLRFEDGESLGSISGVVEGENAYLACDANMRAFYLWDKEGNYLGEVDDNELLGTSYPWKSAFFTGEDGHFYLVCTQQREDKSSNEILVYRIDANL